MTESAWGPERVDALRAVAHAKFSALPSSEAVFHCRCRDSGFLEDQEGFMVPCEICHTSTYERWTGGEYRSYEGGPRREQTAEASERRAEHDRFGSRRGRGSE